MDMLVVSGEDFMLEDVVVARDSGVIIKVGAVAQRSSSLSLRMRLALSEFEFEEDSRGNIAEPCGQRRPKPI
jgi:hypothetical protein